MTDVLIILYTGISNFDSQLYFAVKKFKAYCNDISVFILNNYEVSIYLKHSHHKLYINGFKVMKWTIWQKLFCISLI